MSILSIADFYCMYNCKCGFLFKHLIKILHESPTDNRIHDLWCLSLIEAVFWIDHISELHRAAV